MTGCVFGLESQGSKPCRSKEPSILRELPFLYEGILFSFMTVGHKIAFELIAENKRTRSPFLYLGNLGLTEVGDEVLLKPETL